MTKAHKSAKDQVLYELYYAIINLRLDVAVLKSVLISEKDEPKIKAINEQLSDITQKLELLEKKKALFDKVDLS